MRKGNIGRKRIKTNAIIIFLPIFVFVVLDIAILCNGIMLCYHRDISVICYVITTCIDSTFSK